MSDTQMSKTVHTVPGLPAEIYTVLGSRTGVVRFLPKMRSRNLIHLDGTVAWFDTLGEAQASLVEFVSRMQGR